MQKVAIVYDRVNKWGGAERVLLALHEIFPKAPLYTSVYDPKGAPWAKIFPKIYTSFLQKLPFTKSNHELLPVFMPFVFRSFDFSKYNLVISVTSEFAKNIKTSGKTKHVCYCLTPTRYLWSGYNQYFNNSIIKIISCPVVKLLRVWDKKAAGNPDVIIAISTAVQKRIRKYYGRDSQIVFPPVLVPMIRIIGTEGAKEEMEEREEREEREKIEKIEERQEREKRKYYLLVSRLDFGYKKVDLAIKTFNKLGLPLVIVGGGREEKKLKRLAKENIIFAGRIDEERLKEYYKGAKALIMPQEEDFGIVAVEAQSFGVPVIAYKKGGSSDTVINGKTGILFDKQNIGNLAGAVEMFNGKKFDNKMIMENAKRFRKSVFKRQFIDLAKKMLH